MDRLNEGIRGLGQYIQKAILLTSAEQQRSALEKVQQIEQAWANEFATPLVEKRKQVDEGNVTVAELQIFYLQKDASSWVKNSTEALDVADRDAKKNLEERRKSDETATTATVAAALTSTLIALGIGLFIAFTTARSITEPLFNLMNVAQQIGNTGDLDHTVDIQRNDEIGRLRINVHSFR